MSAAASLAVCLALAVWSALVGGVFKAFSEFIMRALARTAPATGIAAMQQINRAVLRTEFVFALIGIAIIAPLFAGFAAVVARSVVAMLLALAAAIYVALVFLVTIFGNVPMNNRLDALDPASPAAAGYWQHYLRRWTRLNHLRTLGCIATAALYALAAAALNSGGEI
jgi:uncharacterized membrane protein